MKIVVLDKKTLGEDTPFFEIEEHGEVVYYDTTASEQIVERCIDADALIVNKVKIGEKEMKALPKLRLICVFATGFDTIDIKAAKKFGIGVCNVPGYSTESVALFTVSTVLSLVTHLNEYNEFVKRGQYTSSGMANRLIPVYHEIKEMTWGIIGYGNIGKAVARVAEAFGAKVIAVKKTPTDDVECVDINTLCKKSDIITVHVPLNSETENLISQKTISLMKKSVIIVNEARGAVVNENDIANAIISGRIGGFGCDVYTKEPMPVDHPYQKIKDMKNVLLTPHAAWGAFEARERCAKIIGENLDSFFRGGKMNRVDI